MATSSPIAEYDLVAPVHEVSAEVIGEQRQVFVPAGTAGTVVMVHVAKGQAAAYEVEFPLGRRSAALAIRPVIDRTYAFDQIAAAVAYSETGRATGKIVVRGAQVLA